MTVIVNTAWKHPKNIDWDKMQQDLTEGMKNSVPGMHVQWFEIDETTHGSVASFPSQVAYEKNLSLLVLKATGEQNRLLRLSRTNCPSTRVVI